MNKIAQYLNEHILGEVAADAPTRRAFSVDGSILTITPEIVVFPRVTNDIRKVTRFSWQLADKGHSLPITARGYGSDLTGGAIGKGIIVNTTSYMNTIFELDPKQRLIRLQPGVNFKALNDALALYGLNIPSYPRSAAYNSIGGALANNASGVLSGKYGAIANWVRQLEIVLANGDVLQTGRLSKKELKRKKDLQTFEGEIYRALDELITDNQELIESKIAGGIRDNAGYSGIGDVKRKDGSFDLAPLFIGSQGTLGIVSEIILLAEHLTPHQTVGLALFPDLDQARDAVDVIVSLEPAMLEIMDGKLFEEAKRRGKKYGFQKDSDETIGAALLFSFDDSSERHQKKKIKKLNKALENSDMQLTIATDEPGRLELLDIRNVSYSAVQPDSDNLSAPPLFDGVYVPFERYEDFSKAVHALGKKYGMELPLYGSALDCVFHTRPVFNLAKVSEKQKVFKLLNEYSTIVAAHGGHLIGQEAEGRLKSPFAYKQLDDDVLELYAAIKNIFDPSSILNPGVKQPTDLKSLASLVRSDYNMAQFAHQLPLN